MPNKIIIGYDNEKIVKSAVAVGWTSELDLGKDVLDMLRSGLHIQIVDAQKITIGKSINWCEFKEARL